MIRFFRLIRQKLLTENKFNKYLIYAIGEIVLVVIGILIALQINNWNQKRLLGIEEFTHLENLKMDLLEDKISLEAIIARRNDKVKSADSMLFYHKEKKIKNLKDYYFHCINTLVWETHQPKNTTFEELRNSGNLSIISNSKIKKLLLEINTNYEALFEVRDHMYRDYTDYFYRQYSGTIDYESGLTIWSDRSHDIELSQEDVDAAFQNKTITNGYAIASFNNQLLSKQSSDILSKVERTVELIEVEIER
jgi:hypothetical protein